MCCPLYVNCYTTNSVDNRCHINYKQGFTYHPECHSYKNIMHKRGHKGGR